MKSKIHIKPSKRGSLRKHLNVSGSSKIPSSKLSIKSTDSKTIRKKKQFAINARKWEHEFGGELEEYDLGGWLKENKEGLIGGVKAGVGAAMIATGVGAPLGMGLITSGASDIMGEVVDGNSRDETATPYKQRSGKLQQSYQTAKGGMNLNKLTSYNGATHEEGGIPLGDLGVEVEDGEVRTGDMIHSNSIKISKPMLKRYGSILKKSDLNRSVADVVKSRNKKFEKRKGDELNDKAQAMTMMPFEEMSDELSQVYELSQDMNRQMAKGGDIKADNPNLARTDTAIIEGRWVDGKFIPVKKKFPEALDNIPNSIGNRSLRPLPRAAYLKVGGTLPKGKPIMLEGVDVYGKRPNRSSTVNPTEQQFSDYKSGVTHGGWEYVPNSDSWMNFTKRGAAGEPLQMGVDEFEQANPNMMVQANYRNLYKKGGGKINTKALSLLRKGTYRSKSASNPFTYEPVKRAGGGSAFTKFLEDDGNAPIIGSAIGMVTNALTPVEKVKYDQMKFTPTEVNKVSSQPGINQIRRGYGNAKSDLRRLNPSGLLNRYGQLAASEAESISDYATQTDQINAQTQNQASIYDSQNRMRTNSQNQQVSIAEAEANAGNRAMKKSTGDAYFNNLRTQIGQKSRDDKMMDEQTRRFNKMYELQKGYLDLSKRPDSRINMDFDPFNSSNNLGFEMDPETFNEEPIPGTPEWDTYNLYETKKRLAYRFGNSKFGGSLRELKKY